LILRAKESSSTMAQEEANTPTTAAAAQAFDSVMHDHELQNGTASRAGDGDVVMSDAAPNRNNVCHQFPLHRYPQCFHPANNSFGNQSHQQSSPAQHSKPTAPNRNRTSHHRTSHPKPHKEIPHHNEQLSYHLAYRRRLLRFNSKSNKLRIRGRRRSILRRKKVEEVMERRVFRRLRLCMAHLLGSI
jgi:hypothetical protein